jgi:predicted  nucleic acid-binding Zn-ribbon protein
VLAKIDRSAVIPTIDRFAVIPTKETADTRPAMHLGRPLPVLNFFRMHPAIPHLLDLQGIDQHIAALRAEIDSFPKRVLEADAKLNGARAAVAAAKDAHNKILGERKKFEFEVQQWKDRARKYRDQTSAVKTNEAYKALQHEIAGAEAESAKAEDAQLEIMMVTEETELRVKSAEAALKAAEQTINAERDLLKLQMIAKKKELEAALAERERTIVPVPEELRELYARVAKRHNGLALARVRDDQCKGCGLRVLPHILQQLRLESNEEIHRCENCGLILFSLEPLTQPKVSPSGEIASDPS